VLRRETGMSSLLHLTVRRHYGDNRKLTTAAGKKPLVVVLVLMVGKMLLMAESTTAAVSIIHRGVRRTRAAQRRSR
jgi:hypothetical protein